MSKLAYLIPKRQQKLVFNDNAAFEMIDEDWIEVPLIGWTYAGEPRQMELDYDTVSIPKSLVKKETFALRVKGDSMMEEDICDGDIVIIERCNSAENGESVVVRINQEEITMKKLFIEQDGVRLQPANAEMKPIFLKNQDIEILGIVRGILRPT
jgi:repressor LexA